MAEPRAINVDLAAMTREDGSFRTMLAWGGTRSTCSRRRARDSGCTIDFVEQPDGSIKPQDGYGFLKRRVTVPGQGSRNVTAGPEAVRVLKVGFVDVQQGTAR